MTWPLYDVILFFLFIVSMILIALLFPKCNLLGSFVEDKVDVATSDSASMDCMCVCLRVYLYACVCVFKSQHQLHFYLVCLLFC